MKYKTLNINGEKWIKKSHYDKLEKKKIKVPKVIKFKTKDGREIVFRPRCSP